MQRIKSILITSVLIPLLCVSSLAQEKLDHDQDPQQGTPYKVGNGVSAPRVIHSKNARYTDEARRSCVEGTVTLWLIVGTDGLAHDIKIARSLGSGLDKSAVDAVAKWRFDPARKDGKPVPVQINVEVNYHLK